MIGFWWCAGKKAKQQCKDNMVRHSWWYVYLRLMALWGWMAYVICEDGNGFSLSRAFQHYYLHAWHTLCCQACQRHRKVGIKSHKWYMNSKRLCGFGLVLTPRERHAIIQKLQNDVGAKSEPTHFSWKQFRAGCTDWKVLAHSLVYICGSIPL